MHELSLCRSIADIVERHAEGRAVERVRVTVGQFRQVVPGTLVHCWGLVCDGTPLDGSVLEVTEIPAALECHSCGARHDLIDPVFRCRECSGTDVAMVAGDELMITSLDLSEV